MCSGAQRYLVHDAGDGLESVAGVALQHECLPKIKVIKGLVGCSVNQPDQVAVR